MKKKVKWQTRVARTGGVLVLGLSLLYWWIPWEYDIVPRKIPNPNPAVDPDSKLLFTKGTRVMVVTAHPDDAEFYLGGTLPQLKASGAELALVVCTDGDKSYYGPFADSASLRVVRRKEQTSAANAWGCRDITFLGYPDGRLTDGDDVVAGIRKEMDRFRPDYVFAFDGDFPPRTSHQDHRRAGETALTAAKLAAHRPAWMLLFSTIAANHAFDVTKTWDEKERLMKMHASQFVESRNDWGNRLVGRGGDPWPLVQNFVYETASDDGERFGVELAEAVRAVRL